MLIEIAKAGFVNKGSELMLHAILQRAAKEWPDARFAVAPAETSPYQKRARLGLYQKAWYKRHRIQWGYLAGLIPARLRKMYGIVLEREVDVVLDVAGFAYGDQWGSRASSTTKLAAASRRWKRQSTGLILMPQALGPFTSRRIRRAILDVADNADLIFARERVSYDHLIRVTGERRNIKIAPDFTNLVEGVVPDTFDRERYRFCIVPNHRMMDKTSAAERGTYVPFLVTCARHLLQRGAGPFLLIHEGQADLKIAQAVAQALGGEVPIVRESDPLKIKGILGTCRGTVGSRFHGLVSALSQNVPSLGTGWSHKYAMLFEDYGFPEGIIEITAGTDEIGSRIDALLDDETYAGVRSRIAAHSSRLKQASEAMWQDVFAVMRARSVRN